METSIACSAYQESVLGDDQPSDNTIPDTKKKLFFMDKHVSATRKNIFALFYFTSQHVSNSL